jgi:hypothetical protein
VGEGTQLVNGPNPFELSGFSCLAMEDGTIVTRPNGTTVTLKQGDSTFITVRKSDQVKSNKPIQVILLTGDRDSSFQTRWFTMRPIETYADSYVSPVGDSYGRTKVILYNPSATRTVQYTVTTLVNSTLQNATNTLNPKQVVMTATIPTGSGALINGNGRMVALSLTDSEQSAQSGGTGGSRYDWGIPVIPRNELTSQVLIGLGYGCTNNDCRGALVLVCVDGRNFASLPLAHTRFLLLLIEYIQARLIATQCGSRTYRNPKLPRSNRFRLNTHIMPICSILHQSHGRCGSIHRL